MQVQAWQGICVTPTLDVCSLLRKEQPVEAKTSAISSVTHLALDAKYICSYLTSPL